MGASVILTVGNNMMGDDGAGPMLAGMLLETPAYGWDIIDGGTAPENEVQRVRALGPARVLVVVPDQIQNLPHIHVLDGPGLHPQPLAQLLEGIEHRIVAGSRAGAE